MAWITHGGQRAQFLRTWTKDAKESGYSSPGNKNTGEISMPVHADELAVYDPLVQLVKRVEEYTSNDPDAYIRLRRKPFGERAKVFGDQIWPTKTPDFLEELVSRIAGSNSSDPVLVELVLKGKSKVMDLVEIPPLAEAIEHIMQARFDSAKVQGESQVIIAQSEHILRMSQSLMSERTAFFRAWKESENENLRIRTDLLETQLLADYGSEEEPEDPNVTKWRELGKAFSGVMDKGMDPLTALGRYLDHQVKLSLEAKAKEGTATPTPTPTPTPADPASASTESTPDPDKRPDPGSSEGTEPEYVSPDEVADTTVEWLVNILETAPELLTPERLKKLAPHRKQLKMALSYLDMMPADSPGSDPSTDPA